MRTWPTRVTRSAPDLPSVLYVCTYSTNADTPLHVAVRNGQPDMVYRLLAHGALSYVPNRDLPDQDLVALTEGDTCLPAE